MKIEKELFKSEKIESAIADFERNVDFELVPVISTRSTPIDHVKWVLTAVFVLVALICIEAIYFFDLYELNAADVIYFWGFSFVVSFALATLLARLNQVQRVFTFERQRHHHVGLKAQQVFFQKQMYDTETHQGLLLFISLMEKRIVILPDPKSAYSGCKELSESVLKILQRTFKAKHYESGLLEAIEFMKKDLIRQYPMEMHKNQVNELPNKLIWWDE